MSQCRNWLSQHLPNARLVPMASTTVAAETAAKQSGVAAIASQQAGIQYGLAVLAERIEDNPDNVTRFAVIGHASAERTGQDLTSLMFQLDHKPGALADAMAIFKRNRLNLTWIESFPLPGTSKEYLFFVELEGYETDLRVRRAIESLRKKTERLDILGSYARTEPVD
jgi:chorismate mutase/prephenate dehydratase